MHVYREVWIRRMLDREARMVDMQIMAALQNGTAFFASTSLLAVGGGLALLRSTNEALAVLSALPIDISPTPALWEIKCVGLILIFIYAFFKFARAYRLFNYVAILLGSMPPAKQRDTPEAEAHVMRTTRLFEVRREAFQSRAARILLRARLSRLVRQSLGAVRDDGRRGDRHMAQTVRLECLERDGELGRFRAKHALRLDPGGWKPVPGKKTRQNKSLIPQSHFGAKPKSVRRPLALLICEICRISWSDSPKSKISMFFSTRSIFDVRGIAETFCCTSQRRQTWAAVLPWACPICVSVSSFLIRPLATGL